MYNPTTYDQVTCALHNVFSTLFDAVVACVYYILSQPALTIAVIALIAAVVLWLLLYTHITIAVVRVCKYIIKKLK